ncbi:CHAD domain-containing protein [Bdellovibrio svalbardensis]|uniref:CHAD domain-containing protein n=1 Tax=Bdellovibrio svalbardensis TaxID=2972972 RepID=A0ABT6DP50_9BACT|nr:CHAD domain-containing protein [Bdellovibrio svalbardensis]MDG0818267.1 CHAD domain-containing protein [Bdellovibrio svalbardensis]
MEKFATTCRQRFKEFTQKCKESVRHPTPQNIHQLRILNRRIRSIFWIIKQETNIDLPSGVQKKAALFGKELGALREIDVLIKDAAYYNLSDSKLPGKRSRKARKLQDSIEREFLPVLNRDLRKLINGAEPLPSINYKELRSTLKKALKKWPKRLPKKKEKQHQIRIDAKKTIYRMELLGAKSVQLRLLQKSLGRVHDLEVLENHFGKKKVISKDIEANLKTAYRTYQKIFKT